MTDYFKHTLNVNVEWAAVSLPYSHPLAAFDSLYTPISCYSVVPVSCDLCVCVRGTWVPHIHKHTHIQRHTSHIVCNQCAVRVQRSLLITCDESGPEWNTCVPWVLTTITTARGRGRGRWRRAENREGKLFNMELKLKNDVLLRH